MILLRLFAGGLLVLIVIIAGAFLSPAPITVRNETSPDDAAKGGIIIGLVLGVVMGICVAAVL